MTKTYPVIIEKDENGGYVCYVPELSGCVSQGDTLDELMENIREAIELYVDVTSEAKHKSPVEQIKFIGVQQVEV
ncbi:MAG: type II toxin-antitoxin system HicB family antitoxin [Nanoarchaeota archaeon]